MPAKRVTRKAPDPLKSLKVEVYAALGESSIKAECVLGVAADVLNALHAELERLGTLRPGVLPVAEVPSGALYVHDEDDGGRQRLGF